MAPLLKNLCLLGLAAAVSARTCYNLTVPVDLESRNGVFDIEAPRHDSDVTDFIMDLSRQGGNYTEEILKGYKTVRGQYELAGTYCEPDSGPSSVLQILTHGVGFEKVYWDFPANDYNYSYTKIAVDDYGYSTFAYDRLGFGESSRADPIGEIQSWLELSALETITSMFRGSTVPGLEDKSFSKLVHVGHSFGSILSYTMTAKDSCASDGIVLTGFTHETAYMPYFLLGGSFVKANSLEPMADFADGYIAPATQNAVHTNFFATDAYDSEIFAATVAAAQPGTIGEFLTLGAGAGDPNAFSGPALVITGDRDLPFCGGDCSNTGDEDLESYLDISADFLTQASPFESYVVEGAGHALAMEYSHLETTGKILDFLTQNGLAAH